MPKTQSRDGIQCVELDADDSFENIRSPQKYTHTQGFIRDNLNGVIKFNVRIELTDASGQKSMVTIDTCIPGGQTLISDISGWCVPYISFRFVWDTRFQRNVCSGFYEASPGHFFSVLGIQWYTIQHPIVPPQPPFERADPIMYELPLNP